MSYSGSCLCGAVAYEFDGEPRVAVHCHCSQCRKVTGSTLATWVLLPLEEFRWLKGEQQLKRFASSDRGQRLFCGTCGSTLGSLTERRPNLMHLAAGTLEQAPTFRVAFHTYVASMAPWHEITDALPRFDSEPSARPR